MCLAFQTCQSRIILALKNYTRIFHKNGVFKNSACSKWRARANEIADVTRDLLRMLKVYSKSLLLFHALPFDIMSGHLPPAKGTKLFPHPYLLSSWKVSYVNYCCIGFSSKHFNFILVLVWWSGTSGGPSFDCSELVWQRSVPGQHGEALLLFYHICTRLLISGVHRSS